MVMATNYVKTIKVFSQITYNFPAGGTPDHLASSYDANSNL